jgi:hypothetical protein
VGESLRLTREEARVYAQRSARRNRAAHAYMIEGETLTLTAIAARLGISVAALGERMKVSRRRPGPLTWDSLRARQSP